MKKKKKQSEQGRSLFYIFKPLVPTLFHSWQNLMCSAQKISHNPPWQLKMCFARNYGNI